MRWLALVLVAACAHRGAARGACDGPGWLPLGTPHAAAAPAPVPHLAGAITSVTVTGAPARLADTLRGALATRVGQPVERAPVAADVRRLWAFGVASEVRVEAAPAPGGVALAFVVTPQPLIRHVAIAGPTGDLGRLAYLAGTPYEPRRIARIAASIERAYHRAGHLDARIAVRRARGPEVALCIAARPGPRFVIDAIRFPGRRAVPARVLRATLHGEHANVNRAGGTYDAGVLAQDLVWLEAVYWDRGMLEVRVGAPRVHRRGARVEVEIPVDEGPVFRIGRVRVAGTPRAPWIDPGLVSGEVASRRQIAEARDRLAQRLRADVEITASTVDAAHRRLDLTFTIHPRWPWDALRSLSWH